MKDIKWDDSIAILNSVFSKKKCLKMPKNKNISVDSLDFNHLKIIPTPWKLS